MIKVSDILTEVKRIQKDMPDVIYENRKADLIGDCSYPSFGCKYEINDQPACIVGLALYNLGISVDLLEDFDDNDCGESTGIGEIAKYFDDVFEIDSEEKLEQLNSIQYNQDIGKPWGKC